MKLRFRSLNDLRAFLVGLSKDDYPTEGNWTAAQICFHLAGAFEASVQGISVQGSAAVQTGTKKSLKRRLWQLGASWFVTRVRFPAGVPIPAAVRKELEPPSDLQFREELSRLIAGIDRFQQFSGKLPSHPVLGPLSRASWGRFHLRHSEWHLGFLSIAEK